METEAESRRKLMRISKAAQKKKNYQERVKPNIRMENVVVKDGVGKQKR